MNLIDFNDRLYKLTKNSMKRKSIPVKQISRLETVQVKLIKNDGFDAIRNQVDTDDWLARRENE